ncbi:MAG: hypothetical protein HOC24_10620 [Deltaproteobacteria bacterium]|jgi:tetratricopeptide (TPR) repeat protein|nr:hypothetical protein [Deltaproteobacteria bacterium]
MIQKLYLILMLIIVVMAFNMVSAATLQHKKVFQDAQATFEKALTLEGETKHKLMLKAARLFTSILKEEAIENGYLYYNIGNAYYEAGQKGKALVNYKRAERYLSGLEELNSNIQQVTSDLEINIISKSWWQNFKKDLFFWHYIIDYHSRKFVFIAAFVVFWLMMCVLIYKKNIILNTIVIAVLFTTVCFGTSFFISFYEIHYLKEGVVVLEPTETRKGPSLSYEAFYQQPLGEGVMFKLIEEQNNWWKIELKNGDKVWIKNSAAELI